MSKYGGVSCFQIFLGFGLFLEYFWFRGDAWVSVCLLPDYIDDPVDLFTFEV